MVSFHVECRDVCFLRIYRCQFPCGVSKYIYIYIDRYRYRYTQYRTYIWCLINHPQRSIPRDLLAFGVAPIHSRALGRLRGGQHRFFHTWVVYPTRNDWLYTVIYGCIWLYMVVYGYIFLNMVVYA